MERLGTILGVCVVSVILPIRLTEVVLYVSLLEYLSGKALTFRDVLMVNSIVGFVYTMQQCDGTGATFSIWYRNVHFDQWCCTMTNIAVHVLAPCILLHHARVTPVSGGSRILTFLLPLTYFLLPHMSSRYPSKYGSLKQYKLAYTVLFACCVAALPSTHRFV